jgi:hypothetical protein
MFIPARPPDTTTHIFRNRLRSPSISSTVRLGFQNTIQSTHCCVSNTIMFKLKCHNIISMGSPISSIIAEIFQQHLEEIYIKHTLDTKNVTFYTGYVDDILIIYDVTRTSTNLINNYIYQIHIHIKLNPTHEFNRSHPVVLLFYCTTTWITIVNIMGSHYVHILCT